MTLISRQDRFMLCLNDLSSLSYCFLFTYGPVSKAALYVAEKLLIQPGINISGPNGQQLREIYVLCDYIRGVQDL